MVLIACVVTACADKHPSTPDDAMLVDDAAPDATPNQGPIADAGTDATHVLAQPFDLDGSASSDPDGTLVAFQWAIDAAPSGSSASLTNAGATLASFTPDKTGSYTFSLTVTDDDGATDRDTVTILVESGAFTVDAGPDQTVIWQATVHLAGSYVSDSGPGTVTWRLLSQPAGSGQVPQPTASLTPTFFAGIVGSYVAELEVTTPAGTASDTVVITVLPPPPDPIDGNIVDVETGWYSGLFAIASVNPSRVRMLAPTWPTPPSEMVIPLTVTPTAVGVDLDEQFVYVVHDGTRVTTGWVTALSQLGTMDLGTPILEARGGSTPRVYPAHAGPLLLVDPANALVYPGGLVPGPSRGREFPSAERPLYALDIGPSNKLHRYDGTAEDTALVRDWPYPAGQYPLGNDLWVLPDLIITSSGTVFRASEDPLVDMTYRTTLGGDQPFEIVGVCAATRYIATLHNRIASPPQLPESQIRFYDPTTLALLATVPLPDLLVAGVPHHAIGHGITQGAFPNRVSVIGSAIDSPSHAAVFTIPEP